jgi:NAD(P)-dependent dehydrogenase (short-subunit alcohol dehydrogenase family)
VTSRTALVTGCSSGFGLGIAQALRDRGWRVMACVRDPQRAGAALIGCEIVQLDVTDDAQIASLAARIDHLDCLVNNAGYALTGPLSTYDAKQMRTQLEVNVLGPALLTQALLPALAGARGRVINVGSLAGEIGLPLNALYCASKAALHGLTDALRRELADHGIQVAVVVAGGHRTRFMPNMVWGSRVPDTDSVETRQLGAYRAWQQRLAGRPGRSPDPVVQAVVRLTESPRIPRRVYVGRDAQVARGLLQVLPATWADALFSAALRKQLRTGER